KVVATPSTLAPPSCNARASERRNAARQSAGCALVIAREAIVVPRTSLRRHHPLRGTRRQESLFVLVFQDSPSIAAQRGQPRSAARSAFIPPRAITGASAWSASWRNWLLPRTFPSGCERVG